MAPISMHTPPITHPDVTTCTQRSTASSQLSLVHVLPSLHASPPPLQAPAPSQVSVAVQNMPSSQRVPDGANGLLHVPAEHTSLVQGSPSTQLAQLPPPPPHAVAETPGRHTTPSQQPAQHAAEWHMPVVPAASLQLVPSLTPAWLHAFADSSHVSVVQLWRSLQGSPLPTHAPLPSQLSR